MKCAQVVSNFLKDITWSKGGGKSSLLNSESSENLFMKTIKVFALLSFLLLNGSNSRSEVIAGPFTNSSNQHVYFLLSSTNWIYLEAQAVALGGHLATIRNINENFWVWSTFQPLAGSNARLYIGFNDHQTEGQFVWVSGETNRFTHWNAGEPNNAGGEDYTVIRPNDGEWNDLGAPFPAFGVVEIPLRLTNSFRVVTIQKTNNTSVELRWTSISNQMYEVLWTSSLGTTNSWSALGTYLYGNGTALTRTNAIDQSQKFYKVIPIQ